MRAFSRFMSFIVLLTAAVIGAGMPSLAEAPRVTYEIAMPNPTDHVFRVTMHISDLTRSSATVRMPIWIPGYYSDDQYGRNVLTFDASDTNGRALAWRRDGQSAY